MPEETNMANAKSKVSNAATDAAHLVFKPINNKTPSVISSAVLIIARVGIIPVGKKEFTSPVYAIKFFHPEEYLPQNPNLLATADKKPAANAILNSSTAASWYLFIESLFQNYWVAVLLVQDFYFFGYYENHFTARFSCYGVLKTRGSVQIIPGI